MTTPRLSLVLFASLLLMGGCDGDKGSQNNPIPLDSGQVAPTLETNVKSIGESVDSNLTWLDESEFLGCMDGDEALPAVPGEDGEGAEFIEEEEGPDMAQLGTDIVEFLDKEVLTNLEKTDGSTLTYRLDPVAMFCMQGDEEGNESIDPECEKIFEGADVTIQVVSFIEGDLELTLIVNSHKPVMLAVHKAKLALSVNLAEAKAVWDLLSDNFTTDNAPPFTINTLAGVISVGLEIPEAQQVRLFVANTSTVVVDATIEGAKLNLNLAPSEGSVLANQATKTITGTAALAALDVVVGGSLVSMVMGDGCDEFFVEDAPVMPAGEGDGDEFPEGPMPEEDCEPTELDGEFAFALAGFTGTVELQDAQQSLNITGLGFGPKTTTVSKDGKQIFGFDFNADAGRTVDASIALCGDTAQLTLTPSLTVSAAFSLAPLTTTYPDLKDSWIENETLSVTFDGTTPTLGFDPMKVLSGELRFESKSRPELNVTVATGQCFEMGSEDIPVPVPVDGEGAPREEPPDEDGDDDDHPFSELKAGSCSE